MRIRLYHVDEPHGKIFTDEEDVKKALSSGWKKAPWLIHEVEESGKTSAKLTKK